MFVQDTDLLLIIQFIKHRVHKGFSRIGGKIKVEILNIEYGILTIMGFVLPQH